MRAEGIFTSDQRIRRLCVSGLCYGGLGGSGRWFDRCQGLAGPLESFEADLTSARIELPASLPEAMASLSMHASSTTGRIRRPGGCSAGWVAGF